MDHMALAIITEELSRGWLSVGSLIARNVGISSMPRVGIGDDEGPVIEFRRGRPPRVRHP